MTEEQKTIARNFLVSQLERNMSRPNNNYGLLFDAVKDFEAIQFYESMIWEHEQHKYKINGNLVTLLIENPIIISHIKSILSQLYRTNLLPEVGEIKITNYFQLLIFSFLLSNLTKQFRIVSDHLARFYHKYETNLRIPEGIEQYNYITLETETLSFDDDHIIIRINI